MEMGAQLNLGAQVPLLSPAERLGVGGLAGIGLHGSPFGGELLLEGGLHSYSGIGGCTICLFGPDPGASGSSPYVGLRTGFTFQPARQSELRPNTPFVIGLWLYANMDTTTEWVTYTTPGWFSLPGSPAAPVPQTERIGGTYEWGIALRVGFDWNVSATARR
jgi:hypothetical protein